MAMPPEPSCPPHWHQLSITFAEARTAEHHFFTHLGRTLLTAETDHLITAWFFIRKDPWRLRYLPATSGATARATAVLHQAASHLRDHGTARYHDTIYEPETHAFGGTEGMHHAHHLFHADSRNILDYFALGSTAPDNEQSGRRREVSLLLCAAFMRAAGLDRYEQGDVWARVAAHHPHSTAASPQQWLSLTNAVARLTTVGTGPETTLRTGALAFADDWFSAFEHAGRTLRCLAEAGDLTRGIRAVLTHHIIFHWNRLGLPAATQALLARVATETAFADPRDLPSSNATPTAHT